MASAYRDGLTVTMETRSRKVLELREEGKTFAQICETLQISKQTAITDRNRAMAALAADTQVEAGQYRALLTARLEQEYAELETYNDHKSIELKLKIIDRLSALYGLNTTVVTTTTEEHKHFYLDFGSGVPPAPPYIQGAARRLAEHIATEDDSEQDHESHDDRQRERVALKA